MIGAPYSIKLKSLSDATCDVTFDIRPPVEFLTEEARQSFGANVLNLVSRRADQSDAMLESGIVNVTHNSPDGTSSLGYAKIESLRYGSGKEIFIQAILTALNGEAGNLYVDGEALWES